MSTDPEAKLFYGYLEPLVEDEDDSDDEEDDDEDTPWDKSHTVRSHGCIGDLYGYSENLGHFLAVEASLHTAEWDEVKPLTPQDFVTQPEWDEQLHQAAVHFGIDDTGLQPGWYLVCLYF